MTITSLEESMDSHHDKHPGEYALSMNCIPGLTTDAVAVRAGMPHDELRPTTVGQVRGAGFEITQTPGRWEKTGHCDVYHVDGKQRMPTAIELLKLQQAFGAPIPNAGKQR